MNFSEDESGEIGLGVVRFAEAEWEPCVGELNGLDGAVVGATGNAEAVAGMGFGSVEAVRFGW